MHFLYHHSDFTYIHLLKSQTGDESVESKEDSETYAESHGVDIKHNHAENGIFRSELWMNHYKDMHQDLTFSGFNAHRQNFRAERRIR